jgi:magnesium transporter
MSIKAYYLTPTGILQSELSPEEIIIAYRSGRGLLWLDFCGITEEDGAWLEREMGLHPLAVEDCLSPESHTPKIDNFDDYLFIIMHGIDHVSESDLVETAELNLFLGDGFVISSHTVPLFSVAAVQRLVEEDGRPMRQGADLLAHALLDALVDNILPAIDRISDIAGEIEEEVIRRPYQAKPEAITKLKNSSRRVHRVIAPQREMLNRLSQGEFPLIKKTSRVFYRDIFDHLVRIEDLNQSVHDRADNTVSAYLASMASRQNETMRVLSIVVTIFLPLILLVAIYGMLFGYIPEPGWWWGYLVVPGVIGVFIAGVLWRLRTGRRNRRISSLRVDPEKIKGYQEQPAGRTAQEE